MMLIGRDTQFYSTRKRQSNVKPKLTAFEECLAVHKIKYILARVNHPQTNDKCERIFGTVKPQWQSSMHGLRFGLAARRYNDFNDNNRRNVNLNRQPSNRLEMALKSLGADGSMKTYKHLFGKLCSHDNLLLAFLNAKKGRSEKRYVLDFEKNLKNNLFTSQWELLTHTYQPKPLTTFTVRDPKTRKIFASDFRDRVVHHAVCNVIGPIFESRFICDTYANRKGKGTLAALNRFQCFLRKVTHKVRHAGIGCRPAHQGNTPHLVTANGNPTSRENVHSWLCPEMRHTALF